MESFPLDNLPEEILQHVFSFLSVTERLKICLVCKKWFNIINSRYLLRDVAMKFDVGNEISEVNVNRNFLNFIFKSILFDDVYHEFLRNVSSIAEDISIEKCVIKDFRRRISFNDVCFRNLKNLKVIDCDLWMLFPNVPDLAELYLSGNSIITDDGLAILQKSMKKLKVLSLYTFVNFDPKMYKRFYPKNSSYETNPSPYILSLPAVKSFISERVDTLKELNLYFNVDSHALIEISSIENLHLHKISLENCHACINSLFILFENQPSLKSLNLNGIMGLNTHIVKELCNLLPDIEELYVSHGSFTNDTFSYVFHLKKLKKLDISNNYASEPEFIKAIQNFEPIYLRYLNVSGIKISNIDLLIHKCKNLVQLNLSSCKVSDELLHFISKNLIHLQDLSLNKTDITDYGLTGVSEMKLNEIQEVGENYAVEITLNENKTQEINRNNLEPLSNLKGLKKLQLSYCEKITDNGIVFAIRFQYLEYLDLTGCNILSHKTVETLLQENPNLKKMLRNCLQQIPAYQEVYPDIKWGIIYNS